MTYLNPEPHRRTFMKPFIREDVSEYCAACHDDNWQASGVSGQGARSFHQPPKSLCADCHMPLVPSQDPGNHGGQIHSHRFPVANTAVPYANQDEAQLELTEKFLRSGFTSVDILAVSPVKDSVTLMIRRAGTQTRQAPQIMTGFAVGEKAEQTGNAVIREVGRMAVPIDHSGVQLAPGSTARLDVVVGTRKIGHFLPGGTVDAFDVWLELDGRDANGRIIFWSGRLEDDGKDPVEPGARPGAADVAHYLVKIPNNAKGPLTFTASLNCRQFSHYYAQFAYAGLPKPNQDPKLLSADYNSLEYSFDAHDVPGYVSDRIKGRIPDFPIVMVASAKATVPLGESIWNPVVRKEDRERWNDWGIGLRKVTEVEPGYADGWLNVARALRREGETDAARHYLLKALEIHPKLGRIYFFKAMIEKADRKYEDLQMHYTRMLCLRGLGDAASAARKQALFQRFKAEESAQAITANPRLLSPNERHQIHDHESVPLPVGGVGGNQ